MPKRKVILYGAIGLAAMLAIFVAGCAGAEGPPGPPGKDAAATCSDCHNDTTLILSKSVQVDTTKHMIGRGWGYAGGRASCTGCHSSEAFQERVATGIGIGDFEEAPANPSPINCRTCHEIHTTYTKADFALKTTSPVTLKLTGDTFDMGKGNLCASCHQPRWGTPVPEVGGGDVEITSKRYYPHYGTVSSMLLGVGGYGAPGSPSAHYTLVEDSCTTCHMAEGNHTFQASTAGCQSCHADLDTLDRNGVQTEVHALLDELKELLLADGIMMEDGYAATGTHSEAAAGAFWNYKTVYYDGSFGVHNPAYAKALLESAIEALK